MTGDYKKTEEKNNLILIGFMGCGKTTVGKLAAELLRRPFTDTDQLIEKQEGRSIGEIFETEGEAAFRDKETALLKRLSETLEGKVLSVGGGTPVREENACLLRKTGTVVYLRISPQTVYRRLKGDTTRPLLKSEDPLRRIRELLDMRSERYEKCAHITLDVDEMTPEEIAAVILKKISGRTGMSAGRE